MGNRIWLAVTLLVLGLGCTAPCFAQDVPYVELSVGYNFMRYQRLTFNTSDQSTSVNVPKGVYGDVAVNLNHAVGVVGVMTDNQIGNDSLFNLVGGLRFSARGFARGPGRGIPFFQLLGGVMRTVQGGNTYFDRSVQLGGGANITVTDHAGIRAEADYVRTFYAENAVQGDNFVRVSVGFMYGFGAH